MRITSAGITNVGMKRQNNEDNYLINDEVGIYVCCDGMGGHAGGEYASQIAVTTVEEVLANIRDHVRALGACGALENVATDLVDMSRRRKRDCPGHHAR